MTIQTTSINSNELVIATFNVHGWSDDTNGSSSRIAHVIKQHLVDIVGLQEIPRVNVGPLSKELFGNDGYYVAHDATALISRFPIADETRKMLHPSKKNNKPFKLPTVRHCRASLQLPASNNADDQANITITIMVVHLDHVHEQTRLQQLHYLTEELYQNEDITAQLWMGDFNALTHSDYTQSRWDEIGQVRALQNWELPQNDVTAYMTLSSSSSAALSRKNQRHAKKEEAIKTMTSTTSIEKQGHPKKKNATKSVSKLCNAPSTSTGLGLTDAYASSQRGAQLVPSTCRFDTRIDYIYYNRHSLEKNNCCGWTLSSCHHVDTMKMGISDHNMVVATFHRNNVLSK